MIGRRIKEIRNNNSLTQEELADGIISRTYLSLIEKGSVHPSTNVLIKLSERLKCDINDFMTEVSQFKYNDVEVLREITYYEQRVRNSDFEHIHEFISKEYEKLAEVPSSECGRIHLIYAKFYYHEGKIEKAVYNIDKALTKLESVSYNQVHIDAVELKCELLTEKGKYIEALDYLEDVLLEVSRSKDMDLEVIRLLHNMSKCYYLIGEYVTSKRLIERLEKQSEILHIDYKRESRILLKVKILTRFNDFQEVLRLTEVEGKADADLFVCYSKFKLGRIQESVSCFKNLKNTIDKSGLDELSSVLYGELEDKLNGLMNQ